MQDGWIKLHRKMLSNDALFRGGSTFPVFCLLLLLADRDGKVTTGRFELARWLKMNPNTVYKALKRLESLTTIEIKSNNKFTTIYICNWSKYQHQSNTKVTADEHQSNTLTRIENKNKEINISKLLLKVIEIINPKEKVIEHRITKLKKLLKDYSEDEILKAAIAFSKSDWHIKNKQMSVDNLLAPSKFGKWYVKEEENIVDSADEYPEADRLIQLYEEQEKLKKLGGENGKTI